MRNRIIGSVAIAVTSAGAAAQDSTYVWDASTPGSGALGALHAGAPGVGAWAPASAGVNEIVEIEYADGVVYAADSGAQNDQLHTIDPETGEVLSSLTLTYPLYFLNIVTGLEFVDGVMYAAMTVENSNFDSYLGTIDLDSGVITMIAPMLTGADITGLAWDGEHLYGSTGPGTFPKLYRWTLDGASEWVADFTFEGAHLLEGMVTMEFSPEGHLYAIPGAGSALAGHLLIVNRSTAVCLDLGDTGATGLAAITTRNGEGGAPGAGCSSADLAMPFGVLDFSDVISFLSAFGAGCP